MYNKKIKVIVLIIGIVIAVFGMSHVDAALKPNIMIKNDGASGSSGGTSPSVPTNPTLTDPGYNQNLVPNEIAGKTKDVWATVVVLVQIASVACVVFAGLRYMFASADQKADIKQGLIYLTIGAIFVFGAVSIIKLISDATETIL